MKILKVIKNIIFSRLTLAILSLAIQIFLIVFVISYFNRNLAWIFGFFGLLNTIVVLFIINSKSNPSYKIAWIIPILLFPGVGVLVYLFFKLQISIRVMNKRLKSEIENSRKYLVQDDLILSKIRREERGLYNLASYLNKTSNFPIYNINNIDYFESGLLQFKDMIEQLKKAKKFIFIEYFIVERGYMFNSILNILKEKAKEGVEVRIMYDGFGSLLLLDHDYSETLAEFGIKCKIFSPIKPIISAHQNYRDHRKICIIDGKIAYTGSMNIADEYINLKKRFGYWKDTGVKLEGDVVNSFIVMFLELWNLENKVEEYDKYITKNELKQKDGYVIAYADNPLDEYELGKRVYLDIINNALEYVYIVTPYLILDDEMLSALTYASLRGVDVRIVMPSIPDKKLVNYLGKSYYEELLEVGVKIYEYKYGFTHAKMFISDDIKAVVGSINLDYRSLYLHFESAVYFYKNKIIKDIKKDYQDMIKNSDRITSENMKNFSIIKKIIGRILRFLAPLM